MAAGSFSTVMANHSIRPKAGSGKPGKNGFPPIPTAFPTLSVSSTRRHCVKFFTWPTRMSNRRNNPGRRDSAHRSPQRSHRSASPLLGHSGAASVVQDRRHPGGGWSRARARRQMATGAESAKAESCGAGHQSFVSDGGKKFWNWKKSVRHFHSIPIAFRLEKNRRNARASPCPFCLIEQFQKIFPILLEVGVVIWVHKSSMRRMVKCLSCGPGRMHAAKGTGYLSLVGGFRKR